MKSLILCLVVFTMNSTAMSQDNPQTPHYALTFGILNNFQLGKFNGDIAVKKILDDTHQLRLSLSPDISANADNGSNNPSYKSATNEHNYYSLVVGIDYLFVLMTNEDVNLYAGPGFQCGYGYGLNNTTTVDINGDRRVQESKSPDTRIAASGVLGVEWRVSKKIGIHSEYASIFLYQWLKTTSTSSLNGVDAPAQSSSSNEFRLGTNVQFGLSVYF